MPSDLLKELDNNKFDNNSFGIIVDNFSKKVYEKYDTISNRVNRVMEVAFSIVYDLYHDWLDNKNAKKDDYEKLVSTWNNYRLNGYANQSNRNILTKKAKDILDTEYKKATEENSSNSFSWYVKNIIDFSPITDVGMSVFDKDEKYLTAISLLRNEFNKTTDYYDFIKFDVGGTHNEFPFVKNTEFSLSNVESFAFKIIPSLTSISLFTSDSMKDNTIPQFDFTVVLDINRLIRSIISFYDPSNLPEHLAEGENNKDVYIRNGMLKFKNCPEFFTRKIILEIFDNFSNVYGNWEHFIKKFKDTSDKMYKDPFVANLVTKLTHFNMITPNLENNVFDFYSEFCHDDDVRYLSVYNDLIDSLNNDSVYHSEKNLFLTLFCHTFRTFFTTGTSFNLSSYQNGQIEEIKVYQYYKEFFAKYDTNALMLRTGSISDYNIRDFFQTIIKEGNGSHIKPYQAKMSNGENAYFMFCKMRRNIWIDLTISCMFNVKLLSLINECEKNPSVGSKFFIKSKSPLYTSFHKTLRSILVCYRMECLSWNDKEFRSYSDNAISKKIEFITHLYDAISVLNANNVTLVGVLKFCNDHGSFRCISKFDNIVLNNDSFYNIIDQIYFNYKKCGVIPLTDNLEFE